MEGNGSTERGTFNGFSYRLGETYAHAGERVQRVLRTALVLFSERGYEGVSMDAIAEASGVAKQTLYNYFPSKEALFREVLAGAVRFLTEKTEETYEAARGLSPAERWRRVLWTKLELLCAHRSLLRLLVRFSSRGRVADLDVQEIFAPYFSLLDRLLASERESGRASFACAVEDVSGCVTDLFAGAVVGGLALAVLRRALQERPPTEREKEALVAFYLRALGFAP
ncbi:TetR/AcrR family transcriptional regulator [Brockia lithotrophica]|uniref:TetR family transcriptional regulator n=1 Tax=Brockia lithotrophica TaxID=933949 RepID=A0A660L6N4_9BACL|nr:TetR/AcrR family transcriptional regulator [Brockia lithotrophica]RKQ88884.1 TetR family transcriptional regulator [Brockia lithotrophica]